MRTVKIYRPPGETAPMIKFLAMLDLKLQKKLHRQFCIMARSSQSDLKEPHYKHFVLEKYSQFYPFRQGGFELRLRRYLRR